MVCSFYYTVMTSSKEPSKKKPWAYAPTPEADEWSAAAGTIYAALWSDKRRARRLERLPRAFSVLRDLHERLSDHHDEVTRLKVVAALPFEGVIGKMSARETIESSDLKELYGGLGHQLNAERRMLERGDYGSEVAQTYAGALVAAALFARNGNVDMFALPAFVRAPQNQSELEKTPHLQLVSNYRTGGMRGDPLPLRVAAGARTSFVPSYNRNDGFGHINFGKMVMRRAQQEASFTGEDVRSLEKSSVMLPVIAQYIYDESSGGKLPPQPTHELDNAAKELWSEATILYRLRSGTAT